MDSYDHVADVCFVSYDHITQVSQAHISKTNAQTNKAWHAKPWSMPPLYCVQIRELSAAYKRHNQPCPNSPSPTSAILYDRNCYDRNCFPTVIRRWKVAPAFFRPKGMRLHSQKPRPLMENAVFCLSSLAKGTCQYPLFRSRVENQQDPPRASKVSSIRGTGYASAGVRELIRLRLMQNLRDPSFFLTSTTGDE